MLNQKLLETIACLSVKEKKRLRYFVDSSYHNTKYNRAKISRLLERIMAVKNLKNSKKLDKEKLSHDFFPQKPYKSMGKNPIDSLASDLFSLVQQFIVGEDIAKQIDKGQEYLSMARFYRKNNMENRFWKTIRLFRNYQNNIQVHDAQYFLQRFEVEEEVAIFQSTFNTYTGDPNLIAANIALDNFYAITKLEYTSALLFQQHLGQIKIDEALRLGDLLLEEFPKYEAIQTPLAKLNFQIIQLLGSTINTQLLEEFLVNAEAFEDLIPSDKYRNIMAFYRYFIGQQYQLEVSGKDLLAKMFVIYKDHLAKGYFHVDENEKLLPSSLKLMTNIALKVGNSEWARELLEEYPPSRITGTHYQKEAHSLCLAEVLFFEMKYDEAHEQLIYRNFETINYSILADILLIKIYFVEENELIESRISALSQKVRRSKLTQNNKKKYLNFIKSMNQIIKYKKNSSRQKKEQVQTSLSQLVPLIEREWLESII